MPIAFTHIPGKTAEAAVPFFYDFAETATKLGLIEDGGFQKIVVDDPAGPAEAAKARGLSVRQPFVASRPSPSRDRPSMTAAESARAPKTPSSTVTM